MESILSCGVLSVWGFVRTPLNDHLCSVFIAKRNYAFKFLAGKEDFLAQTLTNTIHEVNEIQNSVHKKIYQLKKKFLKLLTTNQIENNNNEQEVKLNK